MHLKRTQPFVTVFLRLKHWGWMVASIPALQEVLILDGEPMTHDRFQLLVIEDNSADIMLLRESLERVNLPHDLIHLPDGGAALDFIRRRDVSPGEPSPHLVLLDLGLPKYDGIQVLRAIRASKYLQDAAVIIVSSSRPRQSKAPLEELGAEMIWLKPLELDGFDDLAEKIKAIAVGIQPELLTS
jgi:CheY-like chemotaxis protein